MRKNAETIVKCRLSLPKTIAGERARLLVPGTAVVFPLRFCGFDTTARQCYV